MMNASHPRVVIVLLFTLLLLGVTSFSTVKANSFPSSIIESNRNTGVASSSCSLLQSSDKRPLTSIPYCGSINLESTVTSTRPDVSSETSSSHNDTTVYQYVVNDEVKQADVITATQTKVSTDDRNDEQEFEVVKKQKKLKVLFLSTDTGGGHRASAESLANQFLKHYPGTEYDLVDVWTPTKVYPYHTIIKSYKHLSAHPRQWRLLYYMSNTRLYARITDFHSKITCYEKIKKQLEEYDPDVVISVHPTMNYIPEKAIRNIAKKKNKYIPFFTVVTDFGSGHCTWFQGNVDMLYVASDRIKKLAKRRGYSKKDNIVMTGLPIREDFAIEAGKMGDRTTDEGKKYRYGMKDKLDLNPSKKTILVMGGGEGVGSLSKIAASLQNDLKSQGVDATICVVCGRNEQLKNELNDKNWNMAPENKKNMKKRKMLQVMKRMVTRGKKFDAKHETNAGEINKEGDVDVVGLGFVSNMAEYMVAADVLVSKAGPGTIAEAAAVGLPVMMTSFLPGQEAGNVDIVLDGGFGEYREKPKQIASVVAEWMQNDKKLEEMSRKSSQTGHPHAASEIVHDIMRISMEKI
mmetsp:Transcript_17817/g.20307  ORF Transcript_17817/g.20307 Transcript_17817/m.20307 type:complete len:576 (-) Transcript_17817:348-2075(-)